MNLSHCECTAHVLDVLQLPSVLLTSCMVIVRMQSGLCETCAAGSPVNEGLGFQGWEFQGLGFRIAMSQVLGGALLPIIVES